MELLLDPKGSQKSWSVYQALKRRILLGELTSASPVTEQSLAAQYSCSQGTIREALMHLQQNGLVERRSYQGTFVTDVGDTEIMLMVKLLLMCEQECIPLAIRNAETRDFTHLSRLATAYGAYRSLNDNYSCAELVLEFHKTIFKLANVPQIETMMHRTVLILHRFILTRNNGQIVPLDSSNLKNPFLMIAEAIEKGDAANAQEVLEKYLKFAAFRLAPQVYKDVFGGDGSEGDYFLIDPEAS
ncbi:MAG: GntR family transcriptional regulator [Rhodobacteraceae bacterium]|nr:GntR family transcriptional regulator [Paracoccaceae bacterium]